LGGGQSGQAVPVCARKERGGRLGSGVQQSTLVGTGGQIEQGLLDAGDPAGAQLGIGALDVETVEWPG
jgi:hypothetical protein